MLEITSELQIPLSQIQFTYVRSSGPGGQNVNKVASKAVLRWKASAGGLLEPEILQRLVVSFPTRLTKEGDIVITSQRTRDALKNHDDCLEKLKTMLLTVLKKKKPRIATRPTKGSRLRRLSDKSMQSKKKQLRTQVRHDD